MAEAKFEDALGKLEGIVDNLENGELNLDDAIKKYEEGMKLSKFCYRKLQEIQKRIELIVKDSSGRATSREFNVDNAGSSDGPASSPAAKVKARPVSRRRRPKGEELLF